MENNTIQKAVFSAKEFHDTKILRCHLFGPETREAERLEVGVSDGDPSQLDDLRVAHAAAVVAPGDGLAIADVKASSCKTEGEKVTVWCDTPSVFH